MTRAQRLKRVFNIDVEICEQCEGPVRIIARIEDPVVIRQILEHLRKKESGDSLITSYKQKMLGKKQFLTACAIIT